MKIVCYLLAAATAMLLSSCGKEGASDPQVDSSTISGSNIDSPSVDSPPDTTRKTAPAPKEDTVVGQNSTAETRPSGLMVENLKQGDGAVATAGSNVEVHYTGWLTDGKKFDSSVDRGTPFRFPLGKGRVIKGWDQGVEGMKVGGKRRLRIPPELGYGAGGAGAVIPPNATLVFEVELLGVN